MRYSLIIWYAISLHLWWGVSMLFIQPHPLFVGTRFFYDHGGYVVWGSILLIAGLLSMISLLRAKRDMAGLYLLLPQQALLFLSAFALMLMWNDAPFTVVWLAIGTYFPSAILHTIAILRHHARELWIISGYWLRAQ